jgi:hypothetical protein
LTNLTVNEAHARQEIAGPVVSNNPVVDPPPQEADPDPPLEAGPDLPQEADPDLPLEADPEADDDESMKNKVELLLSSSVLVWH